MADGAPFDPPVAETRAPQLARWDWQQLERLTEALLAHEPEVLTASQFGTLGQTQFGIDTKAELKGGGCDVASCKKQDEVEDGQLAKWSTAFLKHWDARWKTKGVRRFILVTTADVSRTQVVDAADVERKRFAAKQVSYELWGQPQLIEKIRPHRGIVAQFFGTAWVDILCGPQQREALQPEGASVGLESVGIRQITELRAILSGGAEQRVARALDDLRAGSISAVERTITDLRGEPLWSQLDAGAQAQVLRFAASAALHHNDPETAISLADQAERLQPADEPRIAARVAYQRDGARAGLSVLGTPSTIEGRQLQVALLLSVGDLDHAEAVLAELDREGPDLETTRLHAWALLMRDRREEALRLVVDLERDAGHWIATIRTAAIVRYAAALSPLLGPEWFLNASPVDLDLVRDDDEGRVLLSQATVGFQSLADRTPDRDDRRWLLAALSNQRERRDEAQALARSLIAETPSDPVPIAWSLSRRFDVDLGPSRAIFSEKYARGDTEQIDVRIFALMLLAEAGHDAVRVTLATHLDAQRGDARAEADTWVGRLTTDPGDGADAAAVPATDTIVDDIQRAGINGDWRDVERGFAALAGGPKPEPQTLAVAQLLAAEDQWTILAPYRDAILSFGTSEAVRIVAYIIAETDTDDALTEFVAQYRSRFRNSELPPDVRRLIVDRQRRAGDLVAALAGARALSAQSGVSEDRQLEAQIRATIGDTAGAATIVRDLMQSAELGPGAALSWGEALRANNMALAQQLWHYAVAKDEERQHAVTAFFQAFSLGLEQEASPLFADVRRAVDDGSLAAWTKNVDELPDLLSAARASTEENRAFYEDGQLPAHLLAEQEKIGIDALLSTQGAQDRGPLRIRLLRSGARPRHLAVGRPWSQWHLRMDISALLIAAEFDLLDVIEQHPNPVAISSAAPAALLDMQRQATATQPARLDLLRDLTGLFGQGLVERRYQTTDKIVRVRVTGDPRQIDLDPLQLVEAAFDAGIIDEAALLHASGLLTQITEARADPAAVMPLNAGSAVWLAGAAAEHLASTGLLPALCRAFDIGIDPDLAAYIRGYVATEGAKAERAAWLNTLRERLLRGIEAGRFRFIKRGPDNENDLKEMAARSAATVCLMDMLIPDGESGVVLWFEDRRLTGYPTNGPHIIVEFIEILDALAAENILGQADVRARLSRFLGAGGGFVQLKADDIIPAVRAAPIVEDKLRETPALVAIRRNRAATRLLDERFKVGPGEETGDDRPDESRLFTSDMRLASDCLTAIWSDPGQSIEECAIRSEWVWQSLRVERALRAIPEAEPGVAARNLATLCFSAAIESLSMPTEVPADLRRSRRRAFANWFWNTVLAPHAVGDPDIVERIAGHFEQLYLPRLNGRDPTATRRGLEISLVRVRLGALPPPVINALATSGRFGPFLGLRATDMVTVGRARFDAGRFWRAVRVARRYGRTTIRTIEGKRCRVVRTDFGVAFSGAVRAGFADPLYRIFDAGNAPVERFAQLLTELELTSADVDIFMERARAVSTPDRLSSTLLAARKRSAKAVYAVLEQAFQSHLRIAGEAFLPPPVSALLHFLRLQPGEQNVTERLKTAAETLVGEVGPIETVHRLGGLPVAGLLDMAGIEASADIRAELSRAVTPAPVFRWAEHALAAAASDDERRAIAKEAIARIRRGSAPLVAILTWAVRVFWRDAEFRDLGPADRLTLVWVHSNRVLETFLRRRADSELVARYFSEIEFNEPIADALNYARFVDEDAASPVMLTAETLLFHALGALIGDSPLSTFLDEDDLQSLRSAATLGEGDRAGPSPAFTMRNFDGQNLLGSFLTSAPVALCGLVGEPDKLRASTIAKAIDGIRNDRDDAMAWALLSQHARTGLSEAQIQSAREALLALDMGGLALGPRDALPLPRLIVKAMGLILPLEHRGVILDVIRAVARSAASTGIAPDLHWAKNERGTLDPIHELLEICASYARIETNETFERLEAASIAAVEQWPAAVPVFRELIDRVIRTNGVINARALWRLHLYLNACP